MKGNTATHSESRPTLPLSALVLSPDNARKLRRSESIESLAASIRVMGLIHNLVVVPALTKGKYEVVAGGRRLLAQQLRLERGEIDGNEPIPYDLRERDQATAVSLAENVEREQMHPADEFAAFARLSAEGMSIDRIADAFGVTPLVVERRLALANASPALLDLFRADEISTDQMIALCTIDDHARQDAVWQNAPTWNRDARSLRRMVLDSEIDASRDPRVAFIGGVEGYKNAGGELRRDLFTNNENAGFIADESLLERLVADKLEAKAVQLRAEGWGWVEIHPSFDWQAFNRFGRLEAKARKLPAEAKVQVDALQAKLTELLQERDTLTQLDELTDEQDKRSEAIDGDIEGVQQQITDLKAQHAGYSAEAKALAGAWVTISDAHLRVERGLVKPEDRKAVTKDAAVEVSGGRETKPAGRKNGDALSDALRRSLLGRRNRAAQLAVAGDVRVAKILLAVQMVNLVGARGWRVGGDYVPSDLSLRDGSGTRTHHPIQGEDAEALGEQLDAKLEAVGGKLPKKDGELWNALADKTDAELDAIIACGVAASVSLANGHTSVTAKLLDALAFDVASHVQVTADNYFSRVSKPLILAALKEAGLDHDREQLEKLKKGALASEAERRLREADSRWVPKLIRTPAPKAGAAVVAKTAAKKAAGKATKKPTTRATKPAAKAKSAKRK